MLIDSISCPHHSSWQPHYTRTSQHKYLGKCNYLSIAGPLLIQGWKSSLRVGCTNGSIQETNEDQRQTHVNMYYYYYYCKVNVNSFNVYNITMEVQDCYNIIPLTRSSFPPLHLSLYNLNINILLSETSTNYRLASFPTVAGWAISCMLAICLCGKECTSITSRF